MKRTITLLVLLFFAGSTMAAEPDLALYDKYLVPLSDTLNVVPGASGSLCVTEFRARNLGTAEESLIAAFCDPRITDPGIWCRTLPFRPEESRAVHIDGRGTTGAFIYVRENRRFTLSLRVRDVSRVAQTFGTAIPIPLVSSCMSTG